MQQKTMKRKEKTYLKIVTRKPGAICLLRDNIRNLHTSVVNRRVLNCAYL